MEKSKGVIYELPAPVPPPQRKKGGVRFLTCLVLPVLILLLILSQPNGPIDRYISQDDDSYDAFKAKCTQPDPLFPTPGSHELEYAYNYISTEEFKQGSIGRLSGAVQIPSESFDDLGAIGEDPVSAYPFPDTLRRNMLSGTDIYDLGANIELEMGHHVQVCRLPEEDLPTSP